MVRRMSSPGDPGSTTEAVSGIGRRLTSRSATTTRGGPARVLVELLDAVLARAVAVDEAEEVRRERRSGPPPACG